MKAVYGTVGAAVVALAVMSGCAGQGQAAAPASPAAPAGPQVWHDLAVNCPPLTATGLTSATARETPLTRAIDDATLLGVMCGYRLSPEADAIVDTRLQIDRDPTKKGVSAEILASDRADKKAKGQVVIELPGLQSPATASAEGSQWVEAVTYSQNARLFALVNVGDPVRTEAGLEQHADVLATILRDMVANLRPA